MRKIAVITGTRAEYGILVPLLREIDRSSKLRLSLIATSMHLSTDFGHTIDDIRSDGFRVDHEIEALPPDDSLAGMARSVGRCIEGATIAFEKGGPDIVAVIGDRGEMLAAAVAAAYMNIPVAHIHGGDVSGSIDDAVRHAITKISHIHFPATKAHEQRILKMGEEPWRVHRVGTLAIDSLRRTKRLSRTEMERRFDLDLSKPLIIMVQHSLTSEFELAARQARSTLDAITALGDQCVVVYPNADSGGRRIIEVIDEYRTHSSLRIFKSLPHEDFANLMRVATVMVGNSSAGIIEAPHFRLPVVNIGQRQEGRERAGNVIDVPPNKQRILTALKRAMFDKTFRGSLRELENPYGSGDTGRRIARILASTALGRRLLEKRISY